MMGSMIKFAIMWMTLGSVLGGKLRIDTQKSRLDRRRLDSGAYSGPSEVQTVTMLDTASGPAVEMCTIHLSAITDSSGKDLVREDKDCTMTLLPPITIDNGVATGASPASQSAGNGGGTAVINLNNTTTGNPQAVDNSNKTSANVDPASAGNATSVGETSSSSSMSSSSASTLVSAAPTASSSSVAAISVIGTTVVTHSNTAVASSTTAIPTTQTTSLAASSTPTPSQAPDNSVVAPSSSTTPPVVASAAADEAASTSAAPSAAAAIQLPGTKMQVLPIGLGVFGGVTAIALIVIGYVMWERTKYRKNFRQRKKLAEQGATLGYGGMVERI